MKITSKEVNITGPVGNIQAVIDLPLVINTHYISVNCHPHSLHGGTMTNKVVHTVSRSIAGLGIPSIRFNFRGVGESCGEYDEGLGEQDDLMAVVNWMKSEYPNSKLLLSGFSFGSFVSAFAANKLNPELLISVAPPVKRVSFEGLERPSCDWKVIMGTEDELVDYDAVKDWVESFDKPPGLITMEGASHFFHGRLIELRTHIESVISKFMESLN
jgi:uncharacterized protein